MARDKLVTAQYNSLYQRGNAEVIFELENGDKLSLDFLDEREKKEFVMKSFKLFIKYFSSAKRVPLKELMNIMERAIFINQNVISIKWKSEKCSKILGPKIHHAARKDKKIQYSLSKRTT